jgi:hypothetical protein
MVSHAKACRAAAVWRATPILCFLLCLLADRVYQEQCTSEYTCCDDACPHPRNTHTGKGYPFASPGCNSCQVCQHTHSYVKTQQHTHACRQSHTTLLVTWCWLRLNHRGLCRQHCVTTACRCTVCTTCKSPVSVAKRIPNTTAKMLLEAATLAVMPKKHGMSMRSDAGRHARPLLKSIKGSKAAVHRGRNVHRMSYTISGHI